MFSTCLFCHGRLGKNEVVEHFPVGSRLAFDGARGRLWACVPRMSPVEPVAARRALGSDRGVRAALSKHARPRVDGQHRARADRPRRRSHSDREAAAARVRGVAIRIAAQVATPPRQDCGRRRRCGGSRGAPWSRAACRAHPFIAPAFWAFGASAPLWVVPGMIAMDIKDYWQWERVALRLPGPNGDKLTVRIRHLWESAYYTDRYTDELTLRVAHDGGATHYDGDKALSAGGRLLARANWLGGAGPARAARRRSDRRDRRRGRVPAEDRRAILALPRAPHDGAVPARRRDEPPAGRAARARDGRARRGGTARARGRAGASWPRSGRRPRRSRRSRTTCS